MRQPQGWSGHQCSSMAEVEEPGGGGERRSPKQHGAISGNELTNDHVDGFMDCIDLLGVLGHLAPKTWHANTLASTSVWMFLSVFTPYAHKDLSSSFCLPILAVLYVLYHWQNQVVIFVTLWVYRRVLL